MRTAKEYQRWIGSGGRYQARVIHGAAIAFFVCVFPFLLDFYFYFFSRRVIQSTWLKLCDGDDREEDDATNGIQYRSEVEIQAGTK
jgi:hypothetical protein